ncbi:aminodeoxychorismate synthase, component I [Calderihabitans maritimus]|uniref:aminodeoxychorismate synthase n=1 Tax=Calderihabitans maritimus TaxID=1246530 RepID=A0A1Z5HPD7_9FIRM|nr:aminodeoxychorismate synthase, component I [Calderihabitans maritimus]GAW91308.1 para-aminobenzoate synthase component I [Calderihabitans maritimus]
MDYTPLVKKVSLPPKPQLFYRCLRKGSHPFLLESALFHPEIGRYSFVGSDPFLIFKSKGSSIELYENGRVCRHSGNPFDYLQKLLKRFQTKPLPAFPPFLGGAVGYFGYDLGWHLEKLPNEALDDLKLPDCYLAFYDRVVAVDHQTGEVFLASTGYPLADDSERERRAVERLKELEALLKELPMEEDKIEEPVNKQEPVALNSHFTEEEYCRAVQRAKDYIAAGDIFQVNLSQRFDAPLTISPWELYARLSRINPAPFAALLEFEGVAVVSASPERFLKLEGDRVETRPIKGTRPRGQDQVSDRQLREELWNSEKDRAELVMIVDLERNDLGRVCRFGSVKVEELFRLEEYATVFHLVSTISGRLQPGKDIVSVLKATFPGGSITGAPKIRAMEIIEELEPVKRGIYTGSLGYIDFSGRADLNIVIRTFIIKDNRAYFQAGGGIVADSVPQKEYQETLDKAKALMNALGI